MIRFPTIFQQLLLEIDLGRLGLVLVLGLLICWRSLEVLKELLKNDALVKLVKERRYSYFLDLDLENG